MCKRLILLTLLYNAVLWCAASSAVASDTGLCAIASGAIQSASTIRGLASKNSVRCLVHDREEIRKFLLYQIDHKIPVERLRGEEIVFKILGVIPEDYDYRQGLVDMYLSQLGGYYDPEKKHYVMAGWMPAILQTTIAVHELTHALQDQYYNLEAFIDPLKFTSDQLLARSALVEGDATAVMLDYERQRAGQALLSTEQDVSSFIMQSVLGSALSGGGAKVPYSLQMQLLFPYSSGLRFVHALLKQGGYPAIDSAFSSPPNSTEEVLHPEKYLERKDQPQANAIQVSTPAGWRKIYEDTLGEFVISSLLGSNPGQRATAAQSAAGWANDRVVVFERGESPELRRALIWSTEWDTEKDAQEFATSYRAMLQERKFTVGAETISLDLGDPATSTEPNVALVISGQRVVVQVIAQVIQ